MSQGFLMKKKEQQHLQHQLMLQQPQNSFPSPITPTYDKKLFSSPASSSSSSCRYDSGVGSGSSATEVSSNTSLYSSPSSSASTPVSAASSSSSASSGCGGNSANSHRSSYGQYPFSEVYGSGGNFLSNSYASAAALSSHHDLSRSCSALPSPTIYPPTPPPSSTPWLHPAWFGSLETAAAAVGYMKTPKNNNPFEN